MNLGSVPTVPAGDTLLNTATAPGRPGSQAWTRDGRRFRLVKSGGASVGAGTLMQGPTVINGHLGLIPTADAPIGSRTVRVTAGPGAGTNVPANTYAGGLLVFSTGPAGLSFAIKSHEAIVATQPFTVVLESDDPLWFAVTAATTRIDLIPNPYLGVVAALGTAAATGAVGVLVTGLDAGNWGFVQVEGVAIAVADAAIAIGQAVSPSIIQPGRVGINSTTLPVIGSALQTGINNNTVAISLSLP